MKRFFEYRHRVGFEETNLVGNVYFAHHLRWQGRCRELFLATHAPSILGELQSGLALVTVRVSCDYHQELEALDEIAIRMSLEEMTQNRIRFAFHYWRLKPEGEELVARGEQEVATMRREPGGAMKPRPLPTTLRLALEEYA
jgi:enediyne core biosynthesis thioesterase